MTLFTVEGARALVPSLHAHVEALGALRADLAHARLAVQRGQEPAGGLPEVKATEARLQEAVDWFADQGIQLKGIAPVIVDLPAELEGMPTLLCWLEGERSLDWHHPPETGFAGRRRLP